MKRVAAKAVMVAATAAFFPASLSAGEFEGVIEFIKMTTTDTANYIYYVKGNQIRIENLVKGEVKGVMLVDIAKKQVLALSPERKLYMEVNNSPLDPGAKEEYETERTGNKKAIHGYECEQIIIKNKMKKAVVSYWIATGDFSFFKGLITTVNRKENTSIFYLILDGMETAFPFLAVERSLLREEVARMEVTKISKGAVDDSKFKIPEGYVKFEK